MTAQQIKSLLSEVYSPVSLNRKAVGIELKDSYFKQAKLNLKEAHNRFVNINQESLFDHEKQLY